MGIITFSRTVRVGNSWKNWNTTPTFLPRHLATLFSLIPVNRSPATWTSPEVGRSMPVTMLMRGALPASRRTHDSDELTPLDLQVHAA